MRRYYLAIGLACSAIFLGVYILLYAGPLVLMRFAMAPTTQLPIMAITGVMALLVSLALVSLTFSLAGLSDRGEALGLPRGSVRAVISLSLIVLFAITSFAFQSSFAGGVQKTEALTEGEAAALRANLHGDELVATLPSGDAQRPTVVVYRTGSRTAEDFARQVFTIVGTLMTAVASFYFGSRAAEGGRGDARGARARVDGTAGPGALPVAARASAAGDGGGDGGDGGDDGDGDADGCSVPVGDPTPDEDLPAAAGGVA
jgi:hypothetical protein